jgi:hypothetical protein
MNGSWRSTDNPFLSSTASTGHLFFDKLHIPTTTLPAGYAYEVFAPSPFSGVAGSDVVGIRTMPSGEVHGIPSASQTTLRLAMYATATLTSAQALAVLRGGEWGRTVSGPLSYHHRHAFGARNDLVLDIQAFRRGPNGEEIQWRDPLAPAVDVWQRLDAMAETSILSMRNACLNGLSSLNRQPRGLQGDPGILPRVDDWLGLRHRGQCDDELRAAACSFAVRRDGAAVLLDQALHQREADAEPTGDGRDRPVEL